MVNLIDINMEEFEKVRNQLTYYKGFLPFQFCALVDMLERNKFLETNNLYDDILKKDYQVRNDIKKSSNSEEYQDKLLLDWIRNNQQFKKCIIIP